MTYFSSKTFAFQAELANNNNREWFAANKTRYEQLVRDPFLQLISDLQPDLQQISKHFRADPKPVGGSLFRIYRDARFSNDKSPYKTWSGAKFFHERHKQLHAPSFYLHISAGDCFVGGGLWHPDPATQRKIRDFIVENPSSWIAATKSKQFKQNLSLGGDQLSRVPRGYDAAHPLIDDIKRKDFVCATALSDGEVCSKKLKSLVVKKFQSAAPFIDYLCAALDLEF